MFSRRPHSDRAANTRQGAQRLAFVGDDAIIIKEEQAWSYLSNGYTVFNQEGHPLRMGTRLRSIEVDNRSTAPPSIREFSDLRPEDHGFERRRLERQHLLWMQYDEHEGWAQRDQVCTVHNARTQGMIDAWRVIPPSNRGMLRPARRRGNGRPVHYDRQLPPMSTPGTPRAALRRGAAGPLFEGGDDPAPPPVADGTAAPQAPAHHSRISYDELLSGVQNDDGRTRENDDGDAEGHILLGTE